MTDLTLRPLTLGEILDRSFSLYRRNFALFVGIAGIPQVITLIFNVFNTANRMVVGLSATQLGSTPTSGMGVVMALVYLVLVTTAYLFSQGGTILAVSDLYLGRPTSISESLKKVWDEFGFLFGVVWLNGIAILVAMLFLILPGIYLACRLFVCVPVALIEKQSPIESLRRSFQLTKDFAGRAFMILALYLVLAFALGVLIGLPFGIGVAASAGNPEMMRVWLIMSQVSGAVANILITPILLIATSIFYYDLRVSKEAFDLQFMMNPESVHKSPGGSGIPSILS